MWTALVAQLVKGLSLSSYLTPKGVANATQTAFDVADTIILARRERITDQWPIPEEN